MIYDAIEAGRISPYVKEFWFNGYIYYHNFFMSYRKDQTKMFKRILKHIWN